MYIDLRVKYPLFLSYFNHILTFSADFREILKITNLIKIPLVGVKFFHANGRTHTHTHTHTHRKNPGIDGRIILRIRNEVRCGGTDWIELAQDRNR
jgi:hypothetical protein